MRDEVFPRLDQARNCWQKSAFPVCGVSLSDITVRVENKLLLDIPQLTISPDACTVIMGSNGAGKSLLLRVMHGLIAASTGKVTSFGRSEGLKQAMVFQRPVVFRRTVEANINFALKTCGFGRAERKKRLPRFLEMADLTAQAMQPARKLSGGEQQKLALIRALATEPDLLFLDEPAANLDPPATLAIERLLRQACDMGTKLIMVTHDPGQARRLANDVVFLHRGRVLEQTSGATFFDRPSSPQASAFLAGDLVI